jgi:hypothetical protein
MIDFRDDSYVRRFRRDCPPAIREVMITHVFAAALRNMARTATDIIVHDLSTTAIYQAATRSVRFQMHKLTGHVVRIARDYEVARTASGRPKRWRSRLGPHRTFTEQRPSRSWSPVDGTSMARDQRFTHLPLHSNAETTQLS